ncbi:MAG TPA: hypothetical protein VHR17_13600 [Thermoanaerobaculia bacterium]|nr:hypothetical protein [Thermoanaerobaculia bacterium]
MMRFLLRPFNDLLNGLERCLERGVLGLVAVFAGLIGAWWIYVPIHELLHAFGCELGGGRVWRLEIAPLYGGALLARWLPFVEAGGEYAGRLAGFDTADSVAVHLLTTGLPFLLTVFPGVWLLRWGARSARGVVFGAGLAPATAPFLSVTGDAYEIGSLLTTQLSPWSKEPARTALVGDDLTVVVSGLAGGGGVLCTGLVLATTVGVAWAFLTYAAGAAVARHLGHPMLDRLPRRAGGSA